jgi:hypothetical protein
LSLSFQRVAQGIRTRWLPRIFRPANTCGWISLKPGSASERRKGCAAAAALDPGSWCRRRGRPGVP